MPINSYKASSKKRLFQNFPFRYGMNYQNITTSEGVCKASVNYDISPSGEESYPRPAFVNSIFHNGQNTIKLPEHLIKQTTNFGPTFLIGAHEVVSEEEFVANEVGDPITTPLGELKELFNLSITNINTTISKLENRSDIVEIVFQRVIDGDTFVCTTLSDPENTEYSVRPLGINTAEITDYTFFGGWSSYESYVIDDVVYYGTNYWVCVNPVSGVGTFPTDVSTDWTKLTDYGYEAKNYLEQLLEAAQNIYLVYDEFSEKQDSFDRTLAYVFVYDGTDYTNISALMLAQGYGELAYMSEDYKYFTEQEACYNEAVSESMRIHGGVVDDSIPAIVSIIATEATLNQLPVADASNGNSYYKREVSDKRSISETIYSTKEFHTELIPTAHDFGVTLDNDITIQFLEHTYDEQEYEYSQKAKRIPHIDMPWRNAIGVIGRIIEDGIVIYKGLIYIQYGRIDEADPMQHFILIVDPHEVSLASFNSEDPYSIVYNALDDDPYVFEDHLLDTFASYFARPAVAGITIYDKLTAGSEADARVFKRVNAQQEATVKPYLIIPEITDTDYQGIWGRFRFSDDDYDSDIHEEFVQFVTPGAPDVVDLSVLNFHRTAWDFSQATRRPIIFDMETRFMTQSATKTGGTDNAYFNFDGVLEGNKIDTEYEITLCVRGVQEDFWYNGNFYSNTYHEYQWLEVKDTNLNIVYRGDELHAPDRYSGADFTFHSADEVGPRTLLPSGLEVRQAGLESGYTSGTVLRVTAGTLTYDVISEKTIWKASGASQLISLGTPEFIDQKQLLKTHNTWNATDVAIFDRFIILYGESMGNNSLQFLEFDELDNAPFPYGQITFDSKIIHVHPHMGMLYVFCEDGLWIMHSGISYKDMFKTFAYSGAILSKAEKDTVVSFGNEVFFMSDGKGYVVRANQYIQSKEDVYVLPLTGAVSPLLSLPQKFVQERLQNAYGILVESTVGLVVNYKTKVVGSELHLIASYHINDPIDTIMITFIYDKDSKRWRLYDTIAGGFPIVIIGSSNIKRYDMVLANHYDEGYPTYATYLYQLPDATEDIAIGDAKAVVKTVDGWELADEDSEVPNPLLPVQTLLDSGSLALNSMHKKRVRKLLYTFSNPEGKQLNYRVIPFMDGIPQSNAVTVDAILDEFGDVIESLIQETTAGEVNATDVVIVTLNELGGTSLIETKFTTLSKFELRLNANMLGKLPGFQLYIPAHTRFRFSQYGIRYRQYTAR